MTDVLRITLLGASLVFVGLFILWLLMDLLVRITSIDRKGETEYRPNVGSTISNKDDHQDKQKAAAASIAVAIGLFNASIYPSRQKYKQEISPWQAVHRSQQMIEKRRFLRSNRKRK
jgi:hypothetical protein